MSLSSKQPSITVKRFQPVSFTVQDDFKREAARLFMDGGDFMRVSEEDRRRALHRVTAEAERKEQERRTREPSGFAPRVSVQHLSGSKLKPQVLERHDIKESKKADVSAKPQAVISRSHDEALIRRTVPTAVAKQPFRTRGGLTQEEEYFAHQQYRIFMQGRNQRIQQLDDLEKTECLRRINSDQSVAVQHTQKLAEMIKKQQVALRSPRPIISEMDFKQKLEAKHQPTIPGDYPTFSHPPPDQPSVTKETVKPVKPVKSANSPKGKSSSESLEKETQSSTTKMSSSEPVSDAPPKGVVAAAKERFAP